MEWTEKMPSILMMTQPSGGSFSVEQVCSSCTSSIRPITKVVNLALRKGKWKILHVAPMYGGRQDGGWQLYDIISDPGETCDLSEQRPDILKELLGLWDVYVKETGTVWGEAIPISGDGKGWDSVPEDIIGGE
jgi:hypothetical protein